MKKVLLCPSGSDGDIFPMLTFALELKKRGHQVKVCSLPNAQSLFESHGVEFVVGGLDIKAWSTGKNVRQDSISSFLSQVKFLREDIKKQFEVLKEVAKDADVIFSGGYNMAAPSIAELYNIKHYHVFHVPNVYPTSDHPCMMVPWQKLPKILNSFSWTLNALNNNWCFLDTINQERAKLHLPSIQNVWEHILKDSIMGVDPVLYEMPKDFTKIHHQTGYWYPTIEEELPKDLTQFLEKENNVFYFGFGSMPTSEKTEIMNTLKKVCEKLNMKAIVSKGWADFELENKNDKDQNIFMIGKVSHQKLFAKIRFAIHHGGPGTVSTAAKAGIPQIIVPHILDQFYWGNRINQLGAGPEPLNRRNFSVEKLQGTIEALIENPSYFENAKDLQEKLKNSDGMNDFFHPDFQKKLGIDL